MRARTRALVAAQLVLLAASLVGAALLSSSADWHPVPLVLLLLAVATGVDLLAAQAKYLRVSGSFPALVLAMAFLGPAPAAAIGLVSMAVDVVRNRPPLPKAVSNLAAYAAFPLAGGLLIQESADAASLAPSDPGFAALVFATFLFANVLNFVLVAGHTSLVTGTPLAEKFRTMFLPVLPGEVVTALFTVGIAWVYAHVGMVALALLAVVLLAFQYLLRALLLSQHRAEELEQRTTQLASLQVGVLIAMLQTLSLRDHMTARHSAAVARYARELARAAGCSEEEQDLVHTAGLLHDIGKFIFPDSILLADRRLTDEDWEIVKRHPAQGAKVVRQVDGYGPVADIILCHHERIDGKGYPRGIAGDEIPRLARMISVADTYDTMTARESYRKPVPPAEAIAELKRVAGAQLDAELVGVFVELLESRGVAFQHADDADFEAELAFERRVEVHAEPRALAS